MRKLFLIALVATSLLIDNGGVSAFGHRRGCGGGCGGCGGGCGGGHRHHRLGHHRGGGGCGGCATAACGGCGAAAGCATCSLGGPAGAAYAMAVSEVMDSYVVDDASAIIVVDLPADALLKVDDTATTSTTSNRVFVTPPLESGKSYQYTLTAEVTQDGVLQTVTRQVTVRAGEETRVNLGAPEAAVASR